METRIKITERKSNNLLDGPRFVLTLDKAKSREQQISGNYEVLTKLIGNSDVVISLDSSLMSLPYHQREPYFLKFLEEIRALNLEYRCFKTSSGPKQSFLSRMIFGNRETQEQEVLVYVSNEIWMKGEFKKVLPFYGARYFVAEQNAGGPELLDDMQKMPDDEKLDYFRMIVFDSIYLNSMGISSKYLSLPELKGIFGI